MPQRGRRVTASGDYRIDALVSGYKWALTTVTYSFYEDSVFGGSYYGSESGVREVSEGVKTNVRAIMAWYSTLVNVDFVEVAETSGTVGQLRFMLSSSPVVCIRLLSLVDVDVPCSGGRAPESEL